MRFVYKDIHFGAIASFYVIALGLRLITLGRTMPSNFFQVLVQSLEHLLL